MALDLTALGWSARLEELFAPHAAAGLVPARVILEHTHIYRVCAADGEILARVAGRLRHRAAERADYPAVGDWVAIEPDPHDGDAFTQYCLARAGSRAGQQAMSPRSRSSRPISIRCFSSPASTGTSTRVESNATSSWRVKAAHHR